MIPGTFAYAAPGGVRDAHSLLRHHAGERVLLAGGTWVVPQLECGDHQAGLVVDLANAGLGGVAGDGEMLHVGATCTYATLLRSPEVDKSAPLLRLMARGVTGGPQIRNRGTLGGSVAAARAGFDASTALSAAGAVAVIWGADGERRVGMPELLRGDRETHLDHDEIITAFELSVAQASPSVGYCKLKRSESSWPIVTAAAMVWRDSAADVTGARIAVGGVDAVPVLVTLDPDELAAEDRRDLLRFRLADRVTVAFEDVLATHWYRQAVAPVAAERALADASDRPGEMSAEAQR